MSIGNEFPADGAEMAKALSVNRRWVRGVLKSPLDLERSRLSVHGLHSSHKYNGAVPWETRYIKTHSLNLMRLSIGSQCSSLSSGLTPATVKPLKWRCGQVLSWKIPEFCSMIGARFKKKTLFFAFCGYPSTILRTAYRKQLCPKPMVAMESRDSEGVPIASVECLRSGIWQI